jgi:NADH dehydrogenase
VYVEDVVSAILACRGNRVAVGATYALGGADALSFEALVDRVGAAVGVRPVKVHLPLGACLAALRLLRRLGVHPGLGPEHLLRLQEDKSCSIAAARADLGYSPLTVAEGLERIHGRR